MKPAVISSLIILFISPMAYAEDDNQIADELSLEFLEFIAGFTNENNEWVDPMSLDDMNDKENELKHESEEKSE